MILMEIQDKKNLSVVSWIWNSKVWSILRLIGRSSIGDWPDIEDPSIDLTTWFDGKTICAQGVIQKYRNTAGINAAFFYQLEIQE